MKILHITPSSNGYEEVTLIANRVNRKNHLSVIEKDGEQYYTGGFIMQNTTAVKDFLDKFPKKEQYAAIKKVREIPFVKSYLEKE